MGGFTRKNVPLELWVKAYDFIGISFENKELSYSELISVTEQTPGLNFVSTILKNEQQELVFGRFMVLFVSDIYYSCDKSLILLLQDTTGSINGFISYNQLKRVNQDFPNSPITPGCILILENTSVFYNTSQEDHINHSVVQPKVFLDQDVFISIHPRNIRAILPSQ